MKGIRFFECLGYLKKLSLTDSYFSDPPSTSYPNQPPSSYHAPFEPPYSQPPAQRPLAGYPMPRPPANYTPYNDSNSSSKHVSVPDTYQVRAPLKFLVSLCYFKQLQRLDIHLFDFYSEELFLGESNALCATNCSG